jgi:protein phosphatase
VINLIKKRIFIMIKLEASGDLPKARFGHTFTLISEIYAVLFGGSTALHPLMVSTDTYLLNMQSNKWTKLEGSGSSPSGRVGHAAVSATENQLVLYGGVSGSNGYLVADELYLLDVDITTGKGCWSIVPVNGQSPGRRSGHTLTYTEPFLVLFGGTIGSAMLNDTWILDTIKSVYFWQKIEGIKALPSPRAGHTATLVTYGKSRGIIAIFGGRGAAQEPLDDTWALRKLQNGTWIWERAVYRKDQEKPVGRYFHTSLCIGTVLFSLGGTDGGTDSLGIFTMDTETFETAKVQGIDRMKHAMLQHNDSIYIYGGLERSGLAPIDNINVLSILKAVEASPILFTKLKSYFESLKTPRFAQPSKDSFYRDLNKPAFSAEENMIPENPFQPKPINFKDDLVKQVTQAQTIPNNDLRPGFPLRKAASEKSLNVVKDLGDVGIKLLEDLNQSKEAKGFKKSLTTDVMPPNMMPNNVSMVDSQLPAPLPTGMIQGNQSTVDDTLPFDYMDTLLPGIQRVMSVNNSAESNLTPTELKLLSETAHMAFLQRLLTPKNYPKKGAHFLFEKPLISALLQQAQAVFEKEPTLLKLTAPIKIFGDLHGQYPDLIRLFRKYGSPFDARQNSDIDEYTYLFLGDYVDRGEYSLEIMCMLLALKVKYPRRLFLLRGNHEERKINMSFGFLTECARRLGEDPSHPNSIFNQFTSLFEYMPLAALIQDKVLCMHGGIGVALTSVQEIDNIKRPLRVPDTVCSYEDQCIMDILWSDPAQVKGCIPNKVRDPTGTVGIYAFGPDRLMKFLEYNKLLYIVRAHECVRDGYQVISGGRCITVFSATNYCGTHNNFGAILLLNKNLEYRMLVLSPQESLTDSWQKESDVFKKRTGTPPKSIHSRH